MNGAAAAVVDFLGAALAGALIVVAVVCTLVTLVRGWRQ